MRIPRIYTPQNLRPGATIELDETASHHMLRVLRLQENHILHIFNGLGAEYTAKLLPSNKHRATIFLEKAIDNSCESPLQIHLAQGISRGERMEYSLQKAVELGVYEITPVFTEHTEVKLNHTRENKKLEHWRAIIIHACEQSGRNWLPQLHAPKTFTDFLASNTTALKLIMHPEYGDSLSNFALPNDRLVLLVGSEGGFSETEVKSSQQAGFKVWRFGPRILRTETVAPAALAVLQSHWGDIG